jgi:hypothetical protein
MLNTVDPYVGKYFSPDWVKREILKLTEEQIKEMDKEMESMDDKYLPAGQQAMMQQEQPQEPTPDNPAPPPINNEDALNRDKEFAELQLLETVTEFLKK